jgi:hypothetical protein
LHAEAITAQWIELDVSSSTSIEMAAVWKCDVGWSRMALQGLARVVAARGGRIAGQPEDGWRRLMGHYPNFWHWKQQCDTGIPHFLSIARESQTFRWQVAQWQPLQAALCEFMQLKAAETGHVPAAGFASGILGRKVPTSTRIIFFGDRHGDVRSLLAMLATLSQQGILDPQDPFRIRDPKVIFVGMGDYVDNGIAGVEVIQTLLWFALSNPAQVILLRGNHEDDLWTINQQYFQKELEVKFPHVTPQELRQIHTINDYLPAAAFIGSAGDTGDRYMFCAHGFLEAGYRPHPLLQRLVGQAEGTVWEPLPPLQRQAYLKELPMSLQSVIDRWRRESPIFAAEWEQDGALQHSPRQPVPLGFLNGWVLTDDGEAVFQYDDQKGWRWGKAFCEQVRQSWESPDWQIPWIVRAHQHKDQDYEMLKKIIDQGGIYRSWGTLQAAFVPGVYTLQVAPDNVFALPVPEKGYAGVTQDVWLQVEVGGADAWRWTRLVKSVF